MRVSYFKEKQYVQIHFEDAYEEIQFRMMCKTWEVQDDKLEEFLGLYDDAMNKYHKTHKPWQKKKADMIRWFIRKMFSFNIGKTDDVAEFATGIKGMVDVGKLIEYAFAQGQNRQVVLPKPGDERLVN